MQATTATNDGDAHAFYRHVLETLRAAGVPFLVGGAYAFACYTGNRRDTKDLDIFVRRADFDAAAAALQAAGYRTELTYPHWLAKVRAGDAFVDLIFNSGNGVTEVDDDWFVHAPAADVLGIPVKISPPEEMIWSKAFIMERERFDGADIAHLLRERAETLDWPRLLARFGANWRVLLAHLTLFGFIYPSERHRIPARLIDELVERLRDETRRAPAQPKLCAGTLLSREQYLADIGDGYLDARLTPASSMTAADVAQWTAAIGSPERKEASLLTKKQRSSMNKEQPVRAIARKQR